ncbi:hypothetical protein GCM10011505_28870 [Tistrella bauzanensis]|uniref:Uncharacterized protein n=1 Tax=Tistrella bauzanensis TaxID=657419 RepID=A0ABQ1IM71_9PROT|nr:hypothetical protein GCM10011505_28870 [Tistrella bauzanensis]
MTKIVGIDKLQRKLSEARRAVNELNGDLGTVEFNPHDAASIEAAIQSVNRLGSRFNHIQNAMTAARATAERKLAASLS